MKNAAMIELLSVLKQQAEERLAGLKDGDNLVEASARWRSFAMALWRRNSVRTAPTTECLFPASRAPKISDHEDAESVHAFTKSLIEDHIETIRSKRRSIVNCVGQEVE